MPSVPSCTIALSKLAAGIRRVYVPLSPPAVVDDNTDPPFEPAIANTRRCDSVKPPSEIVTAIAPSRMIFERSAGSDAEPLRLPV